MTVDVRLGDMAIPETDLARIRRWCDGRVPENARDEVRMVAEESPRHVTVVEARAPWDGVGDWTRHPIARLRFTATSGLWSLYWCDSNGRFHKYDRCAPTPDVRELLDVLGSGDDPIFFG